MSRLSASAFLAVVLIVIGQTAVASEAVISFPALTGDFSSGVYTPGIPGNRLATFTIPPEVTSIESMRLVVSGTWNEGVLTCWDYLGRESTGPFQPGLGFFLGVASHPTNPFWSGFVLPANGAFALEAPIELRYPPSGVDLNVLLDSEIRADFGVDYLLPIDSCNITADAYGTVTDVRIVITGTVATEGQSWGGVKALYR
jgi:hypothetical protein